MERPSAGKGLPGFVPGGIPMCERRVARAVLRHERIQRQAASSDQQRPDHRGCLLRSRGVRRHRRQPDQVGLAIVTLFGGLGVGVYAVGWLLLPDEGEDTSIVQDLLNKQQAKSTWQDHTGYSGEQKPQQ